MDPEEWGSVRRKALSQYYIRVIPATPFAPAVSASASTGASAPRRRVNAGPVTAVMLLAAGVAAALSIPLGPSGFGIKGDEATYVTMAFSAAYDLDFVYEKRDLERFWRIYERGPEGIFLKRGQERDISVDWRWPFVHSSVRPDNRADRLYFGKAFLYPLVAGPFVRAAGLNGFLLLHAILLTGVFLGSYHFLAARASDVAAIPFALAFLGASIAPLYAVWLTPEILNLSLVFYAYFLWQYKEVANPADGPWARFLRSRWSDILAAALLGLATYSKPSNALLALPLIALALWRRSLIRALALVLVFAATTAASFGANSLVTGELNYQGGERKTFYGKFPFENPDASFDNRGISSATDDVQEEELLENVVWRRLVDNVKYFFIGRHAGLIPYYFPAAIAAGLCLASRKHFRPWHALILATIAATVGGLLFMLPFTWAGGGGPPGNRY